MTTRTTIAEWNLNIGNNKVASFTQTISYYADYTVQDLAEEVFGFVYQTPQGSYSPAPANVVYPATVDWRELGAVTSVKNQETCMNCYAISAVSLLRSLL